MKPASTPWPQVYLCVALTTMATLLLELSLTRIFSVVFFYHFAFLAISMALFGLGAGGVFSYVVAGWKTPLWTSLGRLSMLNGLLVVAALVALLAQNNDPNAVQMGLMYFGISLPFFLSGTIVSLAIGETIAHVHRVYFFDLMGAAAGCLLLYPLLNGLGGISAVLAAAIIFAVAAAIWHSVSGSVRGRVGSVALALALVAFLILNQRYHTIDIHRAKGRNLPHEVYQHWNVFSRIGLVYRANEGRYTIAIDADAATDIADFDFDRPLTAGQRQELMEQGPALPYALRPGGKTLIIGPGGGWDVARALAFGSHDITGVEINPIIATTIMQRRFPTLSHGLYLRPDVHIYVEDGRSFVRRSSTKYQVLQATLVDTWASTAAGAFALSENNLYTVDAFRDYLMHLSDDGVVAFTRWGFDPPRESLRLISLAREALSELGENQPWRHVIVGRYGSVKGWGAQDTEIVSRKPLTAADCDRARAFFATGHMQAIYLPDAAVKNPFYELLHTSDPAGFERRFVYDIRPVTDNRPFFFYTVQPRDLLAFLRTASHDTADYKLNKAVPTLFALALISIYATLLIMLLPPVLLRARLPRQAGVLKFLLYFLFIGAGYILIEVALIQRFVLFLGHPTPALTVVIFSLLVSSGLGSAAAARLRTHLEGRLVKILGCVAMLAALLGLVLGSLLTALVWLPLALKAAITVALIAPLGFAMGMPFPSGLRRLEQWHAPSVRWAWALNSAASVLGSVFALVSAIYLGLVETMIIGGLFYLAALTVVARVRTGESPAPQPGANRVVLAS